MANDLATAVRSRGMCLMCKLNCIPNCLAILQILAVGIHRWQFMGCSMWGLLGVITFNENFPGSALIQ